MRTRRRLMFALAALLGAATIALPAIASSETSPTVSAVTYTYLGKITHYWSPETVKVGEGADVKFANTSTEIPHGLEFTGGPATPTCSGLPAAVGQVSGATSWQGACSFAKAGTYTFRCTVHPAEMTGTVTVSAAGVTTETTGTTGTSTTGATVAPPAPGEPKSLPTLLAGTPTTALALARTQHGHVIHGSLALAPAAAGGTLLIEALAPRASLSGSGGGGRVVVGKVRRAYVSSGRVAFLLGVDARARRALHRQHRLALLLRIGFTAPGGPSVSLSRQITLHG